MTNTQDLSRPRHLLQQHLGVGFVADVYAEHGGESSNPTACRCCGVHCLEYDADLGSSGLSSGAVRTTFVSPAESCRSADTWILRIASLAVIIPSLWHETASIGEESRTALTMPILEWTQTALADRIVPLSFVEGRLFTCIPRPSRTLRNVCPSVNVREARTRTA